ncbi:flagellar basal-body MS-ring/collar protein FliF [Crenobacter intestini]|uniref:Flagellar M-ring protein n=1 Tax=Crenobacter intestini TaxID=2563443 RepID=A0A4T0US09_9NEIS|nr:flagellar basal-body MS-ring/collar protein FliF [Crenobacter intestini]TIC81421.1 flagellar basal body M-ring protein FliF [Crenobacter intestini]
MAELVDNTTPAWKGRVAEAANRFKALPNNKKLLFFAALAAVFSLVVALVLFNRAPDERVLFSNLSDGDGGQITAALQQMNVPYKLGEGGVISVPADRLYDVRLKLAAQGLPKAGGTGFELMDGQKFGISQFSEQVNYQRAVEGELSRTIESVSAVRQARVHLAIPKQSVFVRERELPTASVMLTLHPGRVMDAAQTAGIMHLVSSSVPNLPLKNVSIVDQDGNLISGATELENGSGLDRRQLGLVRQIEKDYAQRVESILEPIFGKGNAHAQVTAQVDFSELEQTSETYRPNSSPNPSATRSQQIMESLGNGAPTPSGVPGALSNQPPSAASAPLTLPPGAAPGTVTLSGQPLTPTGATRREITTNYEVDKTIQHLRQPKGQVKRLSAAVVVNFKLVPDKDGALKPTALTAREIEQVNALVREAIGYNADRGDSVNVVNAAFADAVLPPTLQDKVVGYVSDNGGELFKYALLAIALAYLLLGVVRPIVRDIVRPPVPPVPERGSAEAAVVGGGKLLAVAGDDEDGEGRPAGAELSPQEKQRLDYDAALLAARELVKTDPRMAAQIIKEWIADE